MFALFFAVFLVMASFAILLPAVMYVLQNLGVSPGMATPVLAGYSVAQFVFGAIWGRLSDRHGRRPILLLTLAGGAASYGMMALYSDSVLHIFIAYMFAGACAGNSAVIYAAVADRTGAENRAKGMGLMGAGIGLAFTLGPALGSWLGGAHAGSANLAIPALASVGACVIGFCIVALMLRDGVRPAVAALGVGRLAAFRDVAARPVLLNFCLLMLVFTFAIALMEPAMPLLVKDRHGWGPRDMGLVFAYVGFVLILVQGGLIGPLSARFGEKSLARAGLVFLFLGLISLAVITVPAGIFIGLTLTSVGGALYNTAMLAMASHQAADHERGLIMGVFQSMQALGRSLGPLVSGLLFQYAHSLHLFAGAFCAGLSIVWLAILYRRMDRL